MNIINQYHKQSELAQAAYAELLPGVPSVDALIAAEMAPAQARAFANLWFVEAQYNDASGASATVFKDQDGSRYLAVRGTDSITDLVANRYILSGWPRILNPQFNVLRSQVQQWMNNGVLPSNYTITGHSLGGYLATALSASFGLRTEPVYLLNAPGVASVAGNVVDAFRAAIGLGNISLADNVQNIRGTGGASLIAGLGAQLAPPQFIETEFSFNPIANHSISTLTDSLAVYALLSELSPTSKISDIAGLIKAASVRSGDTLESSVNALASVFSIARTDPDNRDQLYNGIFEVRKAWAEMQGGLLLAPLIGISASELQRRAGMLQITRIRCRDEGTRGTVSVGYGNHRRLRRAAALIT